MSGERGGGGEGVLLEKEGYSMVWCDWSLLFYFTFLLLLFSSVRVVRLDLGGFKSLSLSIAGLDDGAAGAVFSERVSS